MAQIFLAIYLIVVGLNILAGFRIPAWVLGLLALVAGVLLIIERYGFIRKK